MVCWLLQSLLRGMANSVGSNSLQMEASTRRGEGWTGIALELPPYSGRQLSWLQRLVAPVLNAARMHMSEIREPGHNSVRCWACDCGFSVFNRVACRLGWAGLDQRKTGSWQKLQPPPGHMERWQQPMGIRNQPPSADKISDWNPFS